MKVEKIDHIHVFIKDFDSGIRFFNDLLGTECEILTNRGDWGVPLAYHPLGFEIVGMPEHPEGFDRLSLKVPDIEKAIAELESRGIKLERRINVGRVKEAHFFSDKTFGIPLELAEYQGSDILAQAFGDRWYLSAQVCRPPAIMGHKIG